MTFSGVTGLRVSGEGGELNLGPPPSSCNCASMGLTQHARHGLGCPMGVVDDDETATAALLLSIGRIAAEEGDDSFLRLVREAFDRRGYSEAWVESRGPAAIRRAMPDFDSLVRGPAGDREELPPLDEFIAFGENLNPGIGPMFGRDAARIARALQDRLSVAEAQPSGPKGQGE